MSGQLRPKFPGRVFPSRSSTGGRRRVRAGAMELNKDAVKVGENAARGIRAFYNMLGIESSDEVSWCQSHNKHFVTLSSPGGALSRV